MTDLETIQALMVLIRKLNDRISELEGLVGIVHYGSWQGMRFVEKTATRAQEDAGTKNRVEMHAKQFPDIRPEQHR
jgi:hypothetical protein